MRFPIQQDEERHQSAERGALVPIDERMGSGDGDRIGRSDPYHVEREILVVGALLYPPEHGLDRPGAILAGDGLGRQRRVVDGADDLRRQPADRVEPERAVGADSILRAQRLARISSASR